MLGRIILVLQHFTVCVQDAEYLPLFSLKNGNKCGSLYDDAAVPENQD